MVASWLGQAMRLEEPSLSPESIEVLLETRKIVDTVDRMKAVETYARRVAHTARLAPPSSPFHAVIDEMRAIHDAKNTDYADSAHDPYKNFRRSESIGIPAYRGCFVRLQDKVSRIENLILRQLEGRGGPAVKDETIADTLLDLANYSVICLVLYRQWSEEQGK